MSWSKEFDEPISIPDGRTLVAVHDAASYITFRERSGRIRMAGCDRGADTGSRVRRPDDVCSDRHHEGVRAATMFQSSIITERTSLKAQEAEKRSVMTVLIYVDTSKQVGDKDHLKVFANQAAAENVVSGERSGRRRVRIRGFGITMHCQRPGARSEFWRHASLWTALGNLNG